MNRVSVKGLNFWQFKNLADTTGVRHFVTDRNTNRNGTEFTLSYSSTPDREVVRANRRLLADVMGVQHDKLFFPHQVHLTKIVHVSPNTSVEALKDTDALLTHERNICIAVMSADCVPILLYDKKNKIVAAVHSGWRGTVARILEKTLQEMKNKFNTKGEDVVAGIGPSVSQESYEVGEEVISEVQKAFSQAHELIIPQPGNKAKLDLWRANQVQLFEFGVLPQNIEVSDLCTVKNNNHFFSARKGDSGRFAAGIMLA